jgi:hypothetical protein
LKHRHGSAIDLAHKPISEVAHKIVWRKRVACLLFGAYKPKGVANDKTLPTIQARLTFTEQPRRRSVELRLERMRDVQLAVPLAAAKARVARNGAGLDPCAPATEHKSEWPHPHVKQARGAMKTELDFGYSVREEVATQAELNVGTSFQGIFAEKRSGCGEIESLG